MIKLKITDLEQRKIQDIIEYSNNHIIDRLADRDTIPGDNPNHVIYLNDDNIRVVYSLEKARNIFVHHFTMSVKEIGKIISPGMMILVMAAFNVDLDRKNDTIYLQEISPGHMATGVIKQIEMKNVSRETYH